MNKNKNIEREFKKYNIPFEKFEDGYFLWGFRDEKVDIRDCWSMIASYRHDTTPVNRNLKEDSRVTERARLRENLTKQRYEKAEVREGKANWRDWD